MGVVLTQHDIEHLILLHRLSRHLGVSVRLGVMGGYGMRLGYGGVVPGGLVGRVGINGGGVSPCVHECDLG